MAPKRKAAEMVDRSTLHWASKTVSELKSELKLRGLNFVGRKADIVPHLEQDDAKRQPEVAGKFNHSDDWNSLTVSMLKEELGTRGLSIAGKKADLVARLESDDADLTSRLETESSGRTAQTGAVEETVNVKRQDANGGIVPKMDQQANPFSGKTIAQLKSTLTERNLSVAGKKADLVARLEAYDKGKVDPDIVGPFAEDIMVHKSVNLESGERRSRDFVSAPDPQFIIKLERIRKERMFILDRRMGQDRQGYTSQIFDIAGSTGNIYKVTIGRSPSCDCMDARTRGQKCKHINYALIVILKAPPHLQYQLAFLSDELEFMFANAPITRASDHEKDHTESDEENHNGIRKPIGGDCPICVFEMDPKEELVWCKGACGQNFHEVCFEQWRRSKRGGAVTCVYCRTEWQDASPKKPIPGSLASLKESAPKIGSYRNIGSHPMYQTARPENDFSGRSGALGVSN